MAYSRRYSRIFVTLKQERPDYCLNFRPAMGRCIIEIRNNKGKLLVYAQGLKPNILYKVYMVACEKDCSLAAPVELINIDNSGKGEVKCEFDPDNVFGTGYAIEKFKVIVIMVQGQNDIVVPMAGYIDNVVMWKNNFKYFSIDTNNKDSFGSEQAVEENDIYEETKENNLEIEPEKAINNEENNNEIPLNDQDESESDDIVTNEEITENKEVEDNNEQEQTITEELNINLDNKNVENTNTGEIDIVDSKQESLMEAEDIKELSSESELEIDTTIENKEDNIVDSKAEQIEADTKVLEDNKEKELDINNEQCEAQEQVTELNSDENDKNDKIEEKHSNVELTEERKKDNISNTDMKQEKLNNTDSQVDLQNKIATSQDFYSEDEDIEVKSTNEKIEEEKSLNNSFKSMIGKFKKEFDELKYYTFMTEEESKMQKQHFNYNSKNNKFDDLDYMFKNNPRMTPFDYQNKDVVWIRIDIKELSAIKGNLWKYINNPFIDCSYRKYKHLLLGKYKENEKDCYIFAVPGKYSSSYRLEASLQGFNKFKCCENKKQNENDYGYWILDTI